MIILIADLYDYNGTCHFRYSLYLCSYASHLSLALLHRILLQEPHPYSILPLKYIDIKIIWPYNIWTVEIMQILGDESLLIRNVIIHYIELIEFRYYNKSIYIMQLSLTLLARRMFFVFSLYHNVLNSLIIDYCQP